jgi:hypothetical protein
MNIPASMSKPQPASHPMKFIKSIRIASAFLLTAIPADAGTTIPALTTHQPLAPAESGWHVRTALYGWATMLDGDVTLRGYNAPVDVAFDEILENLDFSVMGVVEVGRGNWSFMADLFYAELSAGNSKGNLDFDVQLDQFIGNFAVVRNVIDDSCRRFDVFAGARVNSMDLDLEINRKRSFSGADSQTWVDPVIGFRYQQALSDKFFFRVLGDIGGFGVSSDLTWQGLAAVGYHISDSASVAFGYRGLGVDYSQGDFGYDVISHGLLLGFEYKF